MAHGHVYIYIYMCIYESPSKDPYVSATDHFECFADTVCASFPRLRRRIEELQPMGSGPVGDCGACTKFGRVSVRSDPIRSDPSHPSNSSIRFARSVRRFVRHIHPSANSSEASVRSVRSICPVRPDWGLSHDVGE